MHELLGLLSVVVAADEPALAARFHPLLRALLEVIVSIAFKNFSCLGEIKRRVDHHVLEFGKSLLIALLIVEIFVVTQQFLFDLVESLFKITCSNLAFHVLKTVQTLIDIGRK